MSLKAKIRNYAKKNNISAQVVLQNFMFERFIERISLSPYKDNFILKGGVLISTILGLNNRATMDLDATIKTFPMNEEQIRKALTAISIIKIEDGFQFDLLRIEAIRKNDEYGGFRATIEATYDTIVIYLSLDISNGDIITPREIQYRFPLMFQEDKYIDILAYNIETILAEKYETILRRGIFSTRLRDYYDIYVLSKTQKYDRQIFSEAVKATSNHRETYDAIIGAFEIIDKIESSLELQKMWNTYQKEYSYANSISFADIVKVLKELAEEIDIFSDGITSLDRE
jgi:hypothetical protein